MCNIDKTIIDNLRKCQKKYNLPYMAAVNLNKEFSVGFKKEWRDKLAEGESVSLPDYIQRTIKTRMDPASLFPWAKSVLLFAIPFQQLPESPRPLPLANDKILGGKIAGYATRRDYHQGGRELLVHFMEEFGADCQYEICIDTKAVAEKALGLKSGLGKIGRNFSLLTPRDGSGCFLGESFTDINLPDMAPPAFELSCRICNQCFKNCSTGALDYSERFDYQNCRSYLNMEKRGMLTQDEGRLLGEWLFGCDDCTVCCPGSKLPESALIDLEWLLMSPAAKIKKQIEGTALEYAGVTLLRRNALIILANRRVERAFNLIRNFAGKTKSPLLQDTAAELLSQGLR